MISHVVNHCIEARCLLRGRILQLLGPFNGRRLLPGAEGTSADGTGPTLIPTENPSIQQIFVSFEDRTCAVSWKNQVRAKSAKGAALECTLQLKSKFLPGNKAPRTYGPVERYQGSVASLCHSHVFVTQW